MGKEGGKLPSLLGDELSFFVTEEATVMLLDGRVGGKGLTEGLAEILVEEFTICIIPFVHRGSSCLAGGRGGSNGVWKGFKRRLPDCRGETVVLIRNNLETGEVIHVGEDLSE